jgi:hypothetical protein
LNIDYEIAKVLLIQRVCLALRICKLLPSLQLLDLSVSDVFSDVYLSIRISGVRTSFDNEIRMSFTAWFNSNFERRLVGL